MSSTRLSSAMNGRDVHWSAGTLLVVAAAVVGLAIAADGAVARAFNGIGGLCWLGAAGLLAWSLRSTERRLRGALATLGSVLVLALFVRPSDLVVAAVGFLVAGALVAAVARERGLDWALLVPAAWLPVHILVRVGRTLLAGSANVRTDPPPTTALVPLTMVLAAALGGWAVTRWRGTDASAGRRVVDVGAE